MIITASFGGTTWFSRKVETTLTKRFHVNMHISGSTKRRASAACTTTAAPTERGFFETVKTSKFKRATAAVRNFAQAMRSFSVKPAFGLIFRNSPGNQLFLAFWRTLV